MAKIETGRFDIFSLGFDTGYGNNFISSSKNGLIGAMANSNAKTLVIFDKDGIRFSDNTGTVYVRVCRCGNDGRVYSIYSSDILQVMDSDGNILYTADIGIGFTYGMTLNPAETKLYMISRTHCAEIDLSDYSVILHQGEFNDGLYKGKVCMHSNFPNKIFCQHADNTIKKYDLLTDTIELSSAPIENIPNYNVGDIAFSPDGTELGIPTTTMLIRYINSTDFSEIATTTLVGEIPASIIYSQDGTKILSSRSIINATSKEVIEYLPAGYRFSTFLGGALYIMMYEYVHLGYGDLVLYSSPEKYLFEDNGEIVKFEEGARVVVGSLPLTQEMFDTEGLRSIPSIPVNLFQSNNPKVHFYTDNEELYNFKTKKIPNAQLISANSDITINKNEYVNLDGFSINGNVSGNGKLRIITSIDSGDTWKFWSGTNWEPISYNATNVLVDGNTIENFNTIPANAWETIYNAGKVRFGYALEIDDLADQAETDQLNIQLDFRGKFIGVDITAHKFWIQRGRVIIEVQENDVDLLVNILS